jgi:ectoine hydroxylase-related dioxygenase (phytanoyl-CoA dioxygenase family)
MKHTLICPRQARDKHEGQLENEARFAGHVKLTVKAGDVALFDTTTWHTASPNNSAKDRENTIIHYHGQELAPTNLNDAIPRDYLNAFDEADLISAERKEILGLDIGHGEGE